MRRLLFGCFFASGAAALILEVLAFRAMRVAGGNTAATAAIVTAALMGGMAVGSFALARLADRVRRPLVVYAALELGVAAVFPALPAIGRLGSWWADTIGPTAGPAGGTLAAAAIGCSVLLIPAVLMGGTLPALARAVVGDATRADRPVGALYAANTAGAVAGTALAGFVFLPWLGTRGTGLVGAALSAAAAVGALAASRLARGGAPERALGAGARTSAEGGAAGASEAHAPMHARWLPLAAIAASGAAAMAYEVAWTRGLAVVLGSSTYAFSAMLAAFLAGLAAGAAAATRLRAHGGRALTRLALVQAGAGLVAASTLPLIGALPLAVLEVERVLGLGRGASLGVQVGASVAVMTPVAVLLGAAFPLAVAATVASVPSVGRDVGRVLGWNTVGAVVGALGAGVLLVPAFGAERTVVAAAALNVATAVILWSGAPARWQRVGLPSAAVAALAAVVAVTPRWDANLLSSGPAVYARQYLSARDPAKALVDRVRARTLLFHEEGAGATVAVVEGAEGRALLIDGKVDASDGRDMQTQVMLGHLPVLMHGGEPRRAFVIGLGSGVTAAAVAQHGVGEVRVAELTPSVVRAAALFGHVNDGVLANPRVRVVIGDGRRLLASDPGRFDVITSEPSNPWLAGQGDLFTREFYAIAREKLAPGGVVVQWIHGYSMSADDLRSVAATFLDVFPAASLWRGGRGDYLLAGGAAALPVTAALERRLSANPHVRRSIARFFADAEDLHRARVFGPDELRSWARGAPLNTDEHPRLEFSAPLSLHHDTIAENERALRAARRAPPPMPDEPRERLEAARRMIVRGALEDAADALALLAPGSLDPALRFERARLLVDLGRPGDAMPDLVALTEERPADPLPSALLREVLAAARERAPARP